MKKRWERSTIGNFCDVIAGQSPEGKYYNADGIGLPFYQGKKDFGEKFIKRPTTWTSETTKVARKNDILMSVRAPVGPINFATEDICIGRGLAAIRSNGMLDGDFLFYQLLYLQPEIAGKEGAVFASINKSEIAALPISVGPLPEQHRIVAILDKAFAEIATAKANAEKNLQNARALFESYLNKFFTVWSKTWVEKPLCEIATILNGYAFKSGGFSSSNPTKSIKITNVGVRDFVETLDSGLPADFAEKFASVAVPAGSLVIALTRTIIADGLKVAIVPPSYDMALVNQRVAALVPNSELVSATYLFSYLSTTLVLNYVKERVNTLMQPNLSINDLRDMPIPLPPVEECEHIVQRLQQMEKESQDLESIYQQKLVALDELKKSLLHQAFSGQL